MGVRRKRGPYRDGFIHVAKEKCSTCIFRPGNLMQLKTGRVATMIAEATANESCIPCHNTLDGDQAVCRGFYDNHATQPIQLAQRLGFIREV